MASLEKRALLGEPTRIICNVSRRSRALECQRTFWRLELRGTACGVQRNRGSHEFWMFEFTDAGLEPSNLLL